MNKSALFFGYLSAAICCMAQSEPMAYPGLMINGISANGEWMASNEGGLASMTIINRITGKSYIYAQSDGGYYVSGIGHYISDNGIVLGSTTFDGDAGYWLNGQWRHLPLGDADVLGAFTNAITPDGNRIVGVVNRADLSVDADELMTIPVYWDSKGDGTYGRYVELPVPMTDFTGRLPQYILADDISADGRVIGGQIRDYAGFNPQPIVWRQDAEGQWTYEVLHTELFVPAGVTYPAWPGDAPELNPTQFMTPEEIAQFDAAVEAWDNYSDNEPSCTLFMTDAQREAYEAALAAWNWDYDPFGPNKRDYMTDDAYDAYIEAIEAFYAQMPDYPQYVDFMSPEEREQYDVARADYDAQYALWEADYSAFMDAYRRSADVAPSFAQNNVILSPDGRYYATTDYQVNYMMGVMEWTPYLFDLQTGEYAKYPGQQIYVNFVNNDGALLGAYPVLQEAGLYNTFISSGVGEPFQPLQDYLKGNSALYEWMTANMRHDYAEYYFNYDTGQVEQRIIPNTWMTGMPTATPDLSVIASWSGAWDDNCAEYYYSYVLPTGLSALPAVANAQLTANITRDGNFTLSTDAHVTICDLNGRVLVDAYFEAGTHRTSLSPGIYVLRATTPSATTTRKIAL